ncbi:hypothetical protein BST61_g7293 [Cercospora zeina]
MTIYKYDSYRLSFCFLDLSVGYTSQDRGYLYINSIYWITVTDESFQELTTKWRASHVMIPRTIGVALSMLASSKQKLRTTSSGHSSITSLLRVRYSLQPSFLTQKRRDFH